MKVVINTCFGGFGLSSKAYELYFGKQGKKIYTYKQVKYVAADGVNEYVKVDNDEQDGAMFLYRTISDLGAKTTTLTNIVFLGDDVSRTDKNLVATVEELGAEANGYFADLKVVEIPDDVKWYIDSYDGVETVCEKHRSWC